jgi:hypothetical protein
MRQYYLGKNQTCLAGKLNLALPTENHEADKPVECRTACHRRLP